MFITPAIKVHFILELSHRCLNRITLNNKGSVNIKQVCGIYQLKQFLAHWIFKSVSVMLFFWHAVHIDTGVTHFSSIHDGYKIVSFLFNSPCIHQYIWSVVNSWLPDLLLRVWINLCFICLQTAWFIHVMSVQCSCFQHTTIKPFFSDVY